jgi:hypothetical protein
LRQFTQPVNFRSGDAAYLVDFACNSLGDPPELAEIVTCDLENDLTLDLRD